MKFTTLPLATLLTLTSAQSNIFADWHPATSTDSRSPCPGLNALSNHGILPRDGRNITLPVLIKGLNAGVNMSQELATLLGMQALKTSSNPASNAFDLADLNKHNLIEHDGSLSRKDHGMGGETGLFDKETFDEFLGYFNGSTQITVAAAAAARWGRLQTERKRNPAFTYSASNRFSSYTETANYFALLQDPTTGTVPIERIKALFTEERLPYNEGWRPTNAINGISVASVLLNVAMNTPENAGDLVVKPAVKPAAPA